MACSKKYFEIIQGGETEAISPIKIKIRFFYINGDLWFIHYYHIIYICINIMYQNRKITLLFHQHIQPYSSCGTFLLISTLIYILKPLETKSEIFESLKTEWIETFKGKKRERNWTVGKEKQCRNKELFLCFLTHLPFPAPCSFLRLVSSIKNDGEASLGWEFTGDSLLPFSISCSTSFKQSISEKQRRRRCSWLPTTIKMYASLTYLMNFFVDLFLLEIPLKFSTFKKNFSKKNFLYSMILNSFSSFSIFLISTSLSPFVVLLKHWVWHSLGFYSSSHSLNRHLLNIHVLLGTGNAAVNRTNKVPVLDEERYK